MRARIDLESFNQANEQERPPPTFHWLQNDDGWWVNTFLAHIYRTRSIGTFCLLFKKKNCPERGSNSWPPYCETGVLTNWAMKAATLSDAILYISSLTWKCFSPKSVEDRPTYSLCLTFYHWTYLFQIMITDISRKHVFYWIDWESPHKNQCYRKRDKTASWQILLERALKGKQNTGKILAIVFISFD